MNHDSKDRYKKIFLFIYAIFELIPETLLFYFVWIRYYAPGFGYFIYPWLQNTLLAFYFAEVGVITLFYGGYRLGHYRSEELLLSKMLSLFSADVIIYGVICMITREFRNPLALIVLFIAESVFSYGYSMFLHMIECKLFPPRKLLLIFGDKGSGEMLDIFRTRPDKFIIEDTVSATEPQEKILEMAKNYDGIIIHRVDYYLRTELIHLCYENGIRAYVVPTISDIVIWSSGNNHLFDTPLFITKDYTMTAFESLVKRISDIVIAGLMLIVFSPIMLIIALLIKCYDKGPVFYTQERVTRGGKHFRIIKFRSMKVDSEADSGIILARKYDDRVTPVGKVIRNIHFDELPQLFNVIKGEMSMVGPRPERPEIIEKYRKEIPEFDYRLAVKAGLTGYAQVYGRYKTTSYNKLKMDILYIENYSLILDLKLLLLTFKILFQKENSEGLEDNDRTI